MREEDLPPSLVLRIEAHKNVPESQDLISESHLMYFRSEKRLVHQNAIDLLPGKIEKEMQRIHGLHFTSV